MSSLTVTVHGRKYWKSVREVERDRRRRSQVMNEIVRPEWWSSDHWATPPDVMKMLRDEFGNFDLDPCCRPETAKAVKFFTEADNGLSRSWHGNVFLNPPYSKPEPWLAKAIQEIIFGNAKLVVALLPVRTDTRWFHRLVKDRAEIRYIQGRIKWIGWQGTPIPSPKNPSMLAIYRGTN